LGRLSREAGHKRVPAPPQRITGRIESGMGWVSAATIDDSANARRVPAQALAACGTWNWTS
jgi:hypothetical protein